MQGLALLAAFFAAGALFAAMATSRKKVSTMGEPTSADKAARVKAIYDRAKARIADLKKRRRETVDGFARAAARVKAENVRKGLE